MLHHLASHLSTLGEHESESEEGDESEFEPLAKKRNLVAQEVGVMHQVSYSSIKMLK